MQLSAMLMVTGLVVVSAVPPRNALALRHSSLVSVRVDSIADGKAYYGEGACQCIGVDNIDGETQVQAGGSSLSYPADVGARCENWDDLKHPDCKEGATPGAGKGWCAQPWCYVDPCKCDIPVLPKTSAYLPKSTYKGRPIYYSYATCGGTDMWTADNHKKACVNQKTKTACLATGQVEGSDKCAWSGGRCAGAEVLGTCKKKLHGFEVGMASCRCIGIDNQPGTTMVKIGNSSMAYPADTGAACRSWDQNRHPDCLASEPPSWCTQAWCYVDPCSCGLNTPPVLSAYLPEAKFQGKPIYYSYATCGSVDMWTKEHHEAACVNQMSEEACGKLGKCSWTGRKCLGKEAAGACKEPAEESPAGPKGMLPEKKKERSCATSAAPYVLAMLLPALA